MKISIKVRKTADFCVFCLDLQGIIWYNITNYK